MSTTAETSRTKGLRTKGFSIRAASIADSDAIFGMLTQLGASFTPDRAAFDSALTDALERADDYLLIVAASPSGEVVGYALGTIVRLFHTNGSAAQLQELVVDDSWRGRRIGTGLVTAVERECRARGAVQLTVASRLRGAAFYEGLGYRSTADYLKKSLDS